MAGLKVNSLRLRFERGSAEPADADIFAFMRDKMKLRSSDLLSMYKEKSTMSVIIKFKTEEDMVKSLERLPGTMDFVIDKYRSCKVTLSAANSVVRYVRLFNLPPEVEDKEIWTVMSRFGNIQRLVRETYGAETGYPIWNSVRGCYIELKEGEEIPATVNVRNMRARVYYEGLVNKCYQCGSTEHIKVDCPQRRTVNERLRSDKSDSYSGALKGLWNKPKTVLGPSDQDKGIERKMTNLNALVAASSVASKNTESKEKDAEACGLEERDRELGHRTEKTEIANAAAKVTTEQETHTDIMEADGVPHTTESSSIEVPHTSTACDDATQSMEAEGCSLKRGRDGVQQSVETDDSSLSDTSNAEKAADVKSSTISGWQKVTTRSRNKQIKLSEREGRSKSVVSDR